MHNFKELKIWQKSRILAKEIYLLTKNFPVEEKFGLANQMRRSVVSISSNIAEGTGRDSDKDFTRFLSISLASAFELETQIIIASDLEYITDKECISISEKVQESQKMIFGFRKTILNKMNSN